MQHEILIIDMNQINHNLWCWLHTGGIGVVPVRPLYCRNTSCGLGPRRKKTSSTPVSDIKCASTWAGFVLPDTKLTIDDTTLSSELLEISIQVSAALCQNNPTVLVVLKQSQKQNGYLHFYCY